MFYGNKTSTQFLSFSSSVTSSDALMTHILSTAQWPMVTLMLHWSLLNSTKSTSSTTTTSQSIGFCRSLKLSNKINTRLPTQQKGLVNTGRYQYYSVLMLSGLCCLVIVRILDSSSPQLNVQTKTVEPVVEGGAQAQQILNIECVSDFTDALILNIQFRLVSESILCCFWYPVRCLLIPDSVCEQVRWSSSEHRSETPCDAEQVFPAHGDDVPGLLPTLETAWSVRLTPCYQCYAAVSCQQ